MSGIVVVAENGKGRYQQEVSVGQHRLLADEPESVGGADAGPAPFDFLMAALGACTSMTLRMYAERKEIALTGVSVEMDHEKIDIPGRGQIVALFLHEAQEFSIGIGRIHAAETTRPSPIWRGCAAGRRLYRAG